VQRSVTNWHVDREKLSEWEALWDKLHYAAREAPGFQATQLLRSVEHPGKFVVMAIWESREAWESYFKAPEIQNLTRTMFPLLKGPPIQEWFELIRDITPES
jgi:quinol monooxygenase YgiN